MKFQAVRDFFLLARASLFRFRDLWMVFESVLIEHNAQRIERLLFGCPVPTIEFSAQSLIYTSHYCEQIQLIAANYDIKPLFFVAAAFNGISCLMSIYHVQVVDAIKWVFASLLQLCVQLWPCEDMFIDFIIFGH